MRECFCEQNMEPGVALSKSIAMPGGDIVRYPDCLEVREIRTITQSDRFDSATLPPECALIYGDNAYFTDSCGNVAYIHCHMRHIDDVGAVRRPHSECRSVDGGRAEREGMDTGCFGISLGQHPSIAMEQNSIMSCYGIWRELERDWDELSREGHDILVRGAFVEGDGEGAPCLLLAH